MTSRLHSIFATMLVPRLRRAALIVLAGCSASRAAKVDAPPPRAEFLVNSADSTFWVTTTSGETRMRGVPLILARFDGRYYELYTAATDLSYDDALLLGERLYRRDLVTGDSALVFADTTVPRIAAAYARAHPDERPLAPNDEGSAQPSTSATAEVDILDVDGPYLSYEYHVDVGLPNRRPWHSTRRGVLDLRSGREARVADLFGEATGIRVAANGRRVYEATRDSIVRARASLQGDDRRAADALRQLQFDERSFSLTAVNGRPAVSFGVPGHGVGAAGNIVELDPLAVDVVDWWRALRADAPTTDDAGNDRWNGPGYQVLARYDTSGQIARLSIADSSKMEWPIGAVTAPLRYVTWLDRPPVTPADRKALTRAFNQAASYDENTRVAARRAAPNLFLVISHAHHQARSRQPARDFRAHDARARQQHGPRVRRGRAVDDGQVRRDLRLSSQPQQRRDRFH
ncbi:MAG: hypothetical protein JWM41_3288 [Gemmatimonadetes bacterium]|nr:hypothetical protein [Gemmatimonadota bacterium]